jgi:hypothetical protein
VRDLGTIAVETIACRALANDAYILANTTRRSVYDAMYLALWQGVLIRGSSPLTSAWRAPLPRYRWWRRISKRFRTPMD